MKRSALFLVLIVMACGLRLALGQTPSHTSPISKDLAIPGGDRLARTALGDFIAANKGALPKTLPELRALMDRVYGSSLSVVVPFSGAPAYTDLEEPRVVFMSPALDLYVAAIVRPKGRIELEFLSRNKDTDAFDFGLVRDFGKEQPKVEFVDRSRCMTCHKAGGPLLNVEPWSNMLARNGHSAKTFSGRQVGLSASFENMALHTAFFKTHSKTDPEMAKLAEIGEKHVAEIRDGKGVETPNLGFHLEGKRWMGADLAPFAQALEANVLQANQMSLVRQAVKEMEPPDRRRAISFLVRSAACTAEKAQVQNDLPGFMNLLRASLLTLPPQPPALTEIFSFSHLTKDKGALFDVEKILDMQARKSAKRLRNLPPEESPLHLSNFRLDSTPLFGKTSFNVLGVGSVADSYKKTLSRVLPASAIPKFCDSPQFDALTRRAEIPNAEQIRVALEEWRKSSGNQGKRGEIRTCMECHDGATEGTTRFPFDVGSLASWRERFTSPRAETRAEAVRWRQRVLRHLSEQTMPPAGFSSHLTNVEREALVKYLQAYGDN